MTTMTQDEIFSVLKALLVEKGHLTKKDAEAGVWTSLAQTAWESYAYHVLGQSMHFLVPHSREELNRLGIAVPENNEQPVILDAKIVKTPVPSPEAKIVKVEAPVNVEPKTLSRVINHDADKF